MLSARTARSRRKSQWILNEILASDFSAHISRTNFTKHIPCLWPSDQMWGIWVFYLVMDLDNVWIPFLSTTGHSLAIKWFSINLKVKRQVFIIWVLPEEYCFSEKKNPLNYTVRDEKMFLIRSFLVTEWRQTHLSKRLVLQQLIRMFQVRLGKYSFPYSLYSPREV